MKIKFNIWANKNNIYFGLFVKYNLLGNLTTFLF